jgi:hypothetical protein
MEDAEHVSEESGLSKPSSSPNSESENKPTSNCLSTNKQGLKGICNYWWTWEVIALILSLSAIVTIVVFLFHYNGEKVPHHHLLRAEVSLNSIISGISTVGKFCVLVPITEGIGQLKCEYIPISTLKPV